MPPGGLAHLRQVCSTEPEGGPGPVIGLFLRSHPDFTAEPPAIAEQQDGPAGRAISGPPPGPEGMDGFSLQRLRRLLSNT